MPLSLGDILQYFSNALSQGSLFALVAIGYTMVYGILKFINFAFGEIFMLGGYIVFYSVTCFLIPWWAAFPVAIGLTGILGICLERIAYRPLRNSPKNSVMTSAIAASFLIQNLVIVIFGGRPKGFIVPPFSEKVLTVGSSGGAVSVISIDVIIPIITAALFIILQLTLRKTRKASFIFGAGSVLAAIGGLMWAMKYPQLNPAMGLMPGLKCFIAAVIGGAGNITGAVLGGLLLGFIEITLTAMLPALTAYRDTFAFVLLIIFLLVKPSGLLGKSQIGKA